MKRTRTQASPGRTKESDAFLPYFVSVRRHARMCASVHPNTTADTPKIRSGEGASSSVEQLVETAGSLVAGTVGSASPAVNASAKAEALTLVPYLRPCLTRKAKYYGKPFATALQGDDCARMCSRGRACKSVGSVSYSDGDGFTH